MDLDFKLFRSQQNSVDMMSTRAPYAGLGERSSYRHIKFLEMVWLPDGHADLETVQHRDRVRQMERSGVDGDQDGVDKDRLYKY